MQASFVTFVRDVVAFARWRLLAVAALTMVAVLVEGSGLLLLVPLLRFLGVGETEAWNGLGLDLGYALAIYVALVAAAAGVVAVRSVAVVALRIAYVDHLRRRLHDALTKMEWRAFGRLAAADVTHVMFGECNRSAQCLDFLLRSAGWVVEIPVLLVIALHLSPTLSAAALGLAAICVVASRPLNRRLHALGRRLGEELRLLHRALNDDLVGMRVVRAFGLEAERRDVFSLRMADVRDGQLVHHRAASTAKAAMQGLAALAAALALWVSVRIFGVPLAETLVLMVAFARLLMAGLRLQDGWRQIVHALPAHAAVQSMTTEIVNSAEVAVETDMAQAGPMGLRHGIRMRHVGFAHRLGAAPALQDVTLEIPARRITALVGPSGAGKSTLADLLLGLTAPDGGEIFIDDIALTGAARLAWRHHVGYVPQDAFLFHDTIRANLKVGAPGCDDVALWDALDRAAADFVRQLPDGLDTVVGDRGSGLSGGERQRLALARALLRRPQLLVLDEPTSALDEANENKIMAALEGVRDHTTVLVVAHRASTVRHADHVVALKDGQVADIPLMGECRQDGFGPDGILAQ